MSYDKNQLADLELTAESVASKPYEYALDDFVPAEHWYIQALWRDERGTLRVFAHRHRFVSAEAAERHLQLMRESGLVTILHVLRSPHWAPDAIFSRKAQARSTRRVA